MSRVTAASNKPHGYKPQPSMLREWADESSTYLDTANFKAYITQIKNAIEELGNPCVAEIKRAIPDTDHRFLFDAVEALCSTGTIKCTRDISPMRWAIHTPFKAQEKRKFMIGTPRKDVRPDAQEVFGKDAIY